MTTKTRKFLGLDGGVRRRQQDPIAWVVLSLVGTFVFVKVALVTALHLTFVKVVSR